MLLHQKLTLILQAQQFYLVLVYNFLENVQFGALVLLVLF